MEYYVTMRMAELLYRNIDKFHKQDTEQKKSDTKGHYKSIYMQLINSQI